MELTVLAPPAWDSGQETGGLSARRKACCTDMLSEERSKDCNVPLEGPGSRLVRGC